MYKNHNHTQYLGNSSHVYISMYFHQYWARVLPKDTPTKNPEDPERHEPKTLQVMGHGSNTLQLGCVGPYHTTDSQN